MLNFLSILRDNNFENMLNFISKIINLTKFNQFNTFLHSLHEFFAIIVFIIRKIVTKIEFKLNYIFITVKTICLIILLLSAMQVTFDYFQYPFEYKLIVSDNKYGFDLPSISVCTETNVLFVKNKVIENFYIHYQRKQLLNSVSNEFEYNFKHCTEEYELYLKMNEDSSFNKSKNFTIDFENLISIENFNDRKLGFKGFCYQYYEQLNYKLNEMFKIFEQKILSEMSYQEMNSLTISSNELFSCSAKIHFRYESSKIEEIANCFDRFEVLQSIYANKEFGICFTFFAKNYSIFLKDNDFIEFVVKYKSQMNLINNGYYDVTNQLNYILNKRNIDNNYLNLDLLDYSVLYFGVKSKTNFDILSKEDVIRSVKTSLNSELRFRKTFVGLLSEPYMKKCIEYG